MTNFKDIGQPIVIASHPRSGTHLTIDLLRKQFLECQSWKQLCEPLDRLYFALESFNYSPDSLPEKTALSILTRAQRPIIKTHAYPGFKHLRKHKSEWCTWLEQEADTFYIIRDGRDVLCSLHLYMQSWDASTRVPLSTFMRQKKNGYSTVKWWSNHVKSWLKEPKVNILRFEDIVHTPEQMLEKISHGLNLKPLYIEPLLPERLKGLWHSRWMRVTSRNSESTAILGCYRNQKVDKWRDVFTESDRVFFHQEAGDLL
ncbi:MAG: sulfotransferase domain-containing protein, partial [Moorea sp. SIO4G2]|nr:sulfotransferase domain-containing protein [Moorena sp. SIO4G2]